MSEREIHEILSKALDADENGDKDEAVEFYTKTVELILKLKDPSVKERLNKYAVQSLDRAEELRGVSLSAHKAQEHVTNRLPNVRSQGKKKNMLI